MQMYGFVFVCIFYVKTTIFSMRREFVTYEMAIHFTFVMCIVCVLFGFFSVKTWTNVYIFLLLTVILFKFISVGQLLKHSPVGHVMCCIMFLIFEYFPDVWSFCSFIWNPMRTQILISLLIYNFNVSLISAFRIISDLKNCLFVIYIIYELRLFI